MSCRWDREAKIAVDYGADAVYLGAQEYGLRAAAENFTMEQLADGVNYAHARGTKVFLTINSFFHNEDFENFVSFLRTVEKIGVDAAIVSDIGVIPLLGKIQILKFLYRRRQAVSINMPQRHIVTWV